MSKRSLRSGDEVVLIAGKDRGKRGKILKFLPGKDRVIVEGLNIIKKHIKRSQQNPQGAIAEREGSVHISNIMPASDYDRRRTSKQEPEPEHG